MAARQGMDAPLFPCTPCNPFLWRVLQVSHSVEQKKKLEKIQQATARIKSLTGISDPSELYDKYAPPPPRAHSPTIIEISIRFAAMLLCCCAAVLLCWLAAMANFASLNSSRPCRACTQVHEQRCCASQFGGPAGCA